MLESVDAGGGLVVSMFEAMNGDLKGAWELNCPWSGSLWESLPCRSIAIPTSRSGWQTTWGVGAGFPVQSRYDLIMKILQMSACVLTTTVSDPDSYLVEGRGVGESHLLLGDEPRPCQVSC